MDIGDQIYENCGKGLCAKSLTTSKESSDIFDDIWSIVSGYKNSKFGSWGVAHFGIMYWQTENKLVGYL